jgi:hypothetical protein
LAGEDPEFALEGRNVWQFAHAAHHWENIWMDTGHPDFPG